MSYPLDTDMFRIADGIVPSGPIEVDDRYRLTPQQVHFFETFGFLHLPGLFAAEAAQIDRGFESVFEDGGQLIETAESVHGDQRRVIAPAVVERSEDLLWLRTDPRVLGLVVSLLGPDAEYAMSDGNLMWCDTTWHCDIYNSPLERYHVKLFFYLDPLDAHSGALRVVPGTNDWQSVFATSVRSGALQPEGVRKAFGVEPEDLPSWTVDTVPGDLVIGNFRSIHGTFNGVERRRLFTMNYREPDFAAAKPDPGPA